MCGNRRAQAGKVMGRSSVLAAGSEGTVATTTLPAASCPERLAQAGIRQEARHANSRHKEEPAVQHGGSHGQQRCEEEQDKRQKIEAQPPCTPPDHVKAASQGIVQEQAERPIQVGPGQAGAPRDQPKAPAQQQAEQQAEQRMMACLKAKVGQLHMNAIRDAMICQQAVWKEQVGAIYNPESHHPRAPRLCM